MEKQPVISFDNIASCGTATLVSVPCMFSNISRTDYDATDAKYTENLLDILQTSGYKVLWLGNDDGCKGVCNRVPTEEMIKINNPEYCYGQYCHDESLLDGLPETWSRRTAAERIQTC
ncbi:MAG: sulfatase-like hydrolase/transferase [Azoarcus sp.]|nr:sulfatase-like hydrolase/transferase [Azoarcus sp.]